MADRKQFKNVQAADSELMNLLEATKHVIVSQEQLMEQRISFAYGNGMGHGSATKEEVRHTAQNLWIRP